MCDMNQTTTTNTSPNATAAAYYQQLMANAQGVAATPYRDYRGEAVAPWNPSQYQALGIISNADLQAQPQYAAASQLAFNAAQPITAADIQQYVNPWTQNVVNATQNQFNNQNAQAVNQVKGNAISQGAFGGNREAVAEANTLGQLALNQAPTIAGLYSSGYGQGVNTALAEQQAKLAGANQVGSLAGAGQQAALQGAGALLGAGTQLQSTQQAQDTFNYQQWLNRMAYPFQTTQWLAGIDTGVGSQLGGTSSTTQPVSLLSQLGGLGISGVGLLGGTGAFGNSGWLAAAGMASGGGISADGIAAARHPTVPESPRTLRAQQKQLIAGHRRVQMFPHGTPELPLPHGMARVETNGDVFHFNPHKISAAEVRKHSDAGHEHHLLDLGPHSKHDILHRINGGELPLAVVERDHEGTEVRSAVGTHLTAREQLAHMHRTKSPGHTLSLEDPRRTLAHRLHLHRAEGGSVPGFDGGGAAQGVSASPYGMAGGPYGGTSLWVPPSQITKGPGAPQPPKAPDDPLKSLTDQAKSVGQVANAIRQGMQTTPGQPTQIAPANGVSAPTPSGTLAEGISPAAADPLGAAPYRRGGVVPRYADGGGDVSGGELGELFVPSDAEWSGTPAAAPADMAFANVPVLPTRGMPSTAPPEGIAATPAPNPFVPPDAAAPVARNPIAGTGVTPAAPLAYDDINPDDFEEEPKKGGVAPATQASPYQSYFSDVEKRRGLPAGTLAPMAKLESAYNPRAYNELSGAKGMFQFIDKTGENYGLVGKGFDNRNDWKASAEAAGKLASDNAAALRKAGLPVTAGTIYLAHQQGAAGAIAILKNPDATAASALASTGVDPGLAARRISANGGNPNMKAGQFAQMWDKRIEGGGDIPPGAGLYAYAPGATGDRSGHAAVPAGATAQADGVAPARATPEHHATPTSGIDLSATSKLWPAMVSTGAAMLASRTAVPGIALGQGLLAGQQTYEQEKHQEQAAKVNQQKIELETNKLNEEVKHWQEQLKVQTKPYEQMTEHEKAQVEETARYHQDLAGREKYTYYPGEGLDEHGNKVPGTWRAPTQTNTGEEPKFFPGMVQTGKPGGASGGVAKWKYDTWMTNHPGDTKGAEEFAAGRRTMSDPEINKAALAAAQKDPTFETLSRTQQDELIERYRRVLRSAASTPGGAAAAGAGAATTPAPAHAGAPTPAPAKEPASLPPGVPEGSRLLRNKNDPSKYFFKAPDGSLYTPDGKLYRAAQAAASP